MPTTAACRWARTRTFRGQPLDATSVVMAFTVTGDANLDGMVNDDDVTIVGATYAPGVSQPHWALGDFDYNGFVDDDDITLVGRVVQDRSGLLAHQSCASGLDGGRRQCPLPRCLRTWAASRADVSISAAEMAAIADEVFAEAEQPRRSQMADGGQLRAAASLNS